MIQVLNRAFDILENVAKNPDMPKTLSEIAARVNIQSSTCANIVKTLTARGYLSKAESQKGYVLGKQVEYLLGNNSCLQKLTEVGNIELQKLTEVLNENTLIAILEKNIRKIICKKLSNQQVQAHTPDIKNAYDSSTGRVLLAMQNDEFLKSYIQSFGLPDAGLWAEAKTESGFFSQIEKIRKTGYALIEDSVQVIGFAAPVYMNDKPIAALSIYMPAFRYSDELRNLFIDLGLKAADRISKLL